MRCSAPAATCLPPSCRPSSCCPSACPLGLQAANYQIAQMRNFYRRMSTDGPLKAAVFTEVELDTAEVRSFGCAGVLLLVHCVKLQVLSVMHSALLVQACCRAPPVPAEQPVPLALVLCRMGCLTPWDHARRPQLFLSNQSVELFCLLFSCAGCAARRAGRAARRHQAAALRVLRGRADGGGAFPRLMQCW